MVVLMRQPSRRLAHGVCLVTLLGLVGCDNLPWSKTKGDAVATAGPTTAQSGLTPAKPVVLPTEIMANVNQVPISKADLELRLQELKAQTLAGGGEWRQLSADELQVILTEQVNWELMSQDAVARGLDRSLDVQRRWEYLRRGFFAQEWLRWDEKQVTPTAAHIEQFYEQNKGSPGIKMPARIRVRQLVVASEDQVKQAVSQLHAGTVAFEDLAKQISLGPTASEGGLVQEWVMRANDKGLYYASEEEAAAEDVISLDPVLEAAAFAIDAVGHLSNYVKGADSRYHIFQLVEHQPERIKDISEVWDQIHAVLLQQNLSAAIEALRKQAAVEEFADRLEGVAQ